MIPAVIVPLLKEQGYDPHIFYIKIGLEGRDDIMDCPSEEDIEITTFIAKKYGCKFDIVDLQKEYFDRVARYTMDSVRKGLTPNPDVMCNRFIKFGAFEEKAGYQFDRIATGHYATQWIDSEGIAWLGTAVDVPFVDDGDVVFVRFLKLIDHAFHRLVRANHIAWNHHEMFNRQIVEVGVEHYLAYVVKQDVSFENAVFVYHREYVARGGRDKRNKVAEGPIKTYPAPDRESC